MLNHEVRQARRYLDKGWSQKRITRLQKYADRFSGYRSETHTFHGGRSKGYAEGQLEEALDTKEAMDLLREELEILLKNNQVAGIKSEEVQGCIGRIKQMIPSLWEEEKEGSN